jgi:putative membrane protein
MAKLSSCAMRYSQKGGKVASDGEFRPQLRLHPLSWLFALTTSIRQMIVPLIALFFFGARDQASAMAPLFLPLVVAALVARALWRQWIFRYGFGPRGLVILDGLFFRNVRQIEYARIENIDTERGLLHRLFGVADVSVQTSTGGKDEARISVLDLAAVGAMRERIFARERPATRTASAEDALLRLPPPELVRYGLIDNRGMIIVAAAGGVLYEFGLPSVNREAVFAWFDASPFAEIAGLGPVIQALFALAAVASALLAVRILSVMLALVTLFDFTLTRDGADLRIRHGLLTRIALTVRTPRIQAVHQTRSLLHRWFDRASLTVDLTGDAASAAGAEQQQASARTRWLAPVCRTDDAPRLTAAALPGVDLALEPAWRRLAPGARGRILRRTFVVYALLTLAPAIWYLRAGAALVVLAGLPLAWLHAHMYVKHTAWALTSDAVMFRYGWLTRRMAIAPRDRVQVVALETSPFDRRWRMASVLVDTAGASLGRRIHVRYIDETAARELVSDLYALRR